MANNAQWADACAETRVRVALGSVAELDEEALAAAGVQGVLKLPNNVLHLLVGLNADQFAAEMKAAIYRVPLFISPAHQHRRSAAPAGKRTSSACRWYQTLRCAPVSQTATVSAVPRRVGCAFLPTRLLCFEG